MVAGNGFVKARAHTMMAAELLAKWEAVLSGTGCGCPLCTRDLLDDIAMRFREVIAVRIYERRADL
jgi:hypothetical protein